MKKEQVELVIEQVVVGIYEAYPEILERFGDVGKQRCYEDNWHHFDHLETADRLGDAIIFTNYAQWLTDLLVSRGMSAKHIIDNFERIHTALQTLDTDEAKRYQTLLQKGIEAIMAKA